jgi:hypothetical protein
MRFLFLAGIIFSPLLASCLDMVPPYEEKKDKPLINAAFVLAAILFAILTFPSEQSLAAGVEKIYPARAVSHLRSLAGQGGSHVLNDYLWGGYLVLYCRDVPVFIDSRVDIFEYRGVVKDYLDFSNITNTFEILDKYDIRYALLRTNGAQSYLLQRAPQWQTVYSDNIATIFARRPVPFSSQSH